MNKFPVKTIADLVNDGMLARLEWMTLQPNIILELDNGFTHDSPLKNKYINAEIIRLNHDIVSYGSLQLEDQSIDMIFANLILPWCDDWVTVFNEWYRVLRPEGIMMLSALGLQTAHEYQYPNLRLAKLMDMHEIGDFLIQAKFLEPVVDVEHTRFIYHEAEHCLRELDEMRIFQQDISFNLVKQSSDRFEMSYEIIYAHAFAPAKNLSSQHDEGIAFFPVASLRRRA